MSLSSKERPSDSPYVETVMYGRTTSDGRVIRPAAVNWHMVVSKRCGRTHFLVVGPWSSSGVVRYSSGAEILWIQLKLGAYMPHLPTRKLTDRETELPEASRQSFWLKGSTWELPSYENAEIFIDRLVREDVLVRDSVVNAMVGGSLSKMPSRTVRHRFLHATGLSQSQIYQYQRAQQAIALLRRGVPILDTVHQAGYYDQPHLTKSLKRFVGYTPAQIAP